MQLQSIQLLPLSLLSLGTSFTLFLSSLELDISYTKMTGSGFTWLNVSLLNSSVVSSSSMTIASSAFLSRSSSLHSHCWSPPDLPSPLPASHFSLVHFQLRLHSFWLLPQSRVSFCNCSGDSSQLSFGFSIATSTASSSFSAKAFLLLKAVLLVYPATTFTSLAASLVS